MANNSNIVDNAFNFSDGDICMHSVRFESFVPVHEVPLREPATTAELEETLTHLIDSTLPGFVIRQSGCNWVSLNDIPALALTLNEVLVTLDTAFELQGLDDTLRRSQGPGNLHRDAIRVSGPVDTLILHRTTSGAGKVSIANSGELMPGKGMSEVRAYEYNEAVDAAVGKNLLSNGAVDPCYMQPELHTAELKTGDFTIIAMFNTYGPVWHRFDTSTKERTAETDDFVKIEAF